MAKMKWVSITLGFTEKRVDELLDGHASGVSSWLHSKVGSWRSAAGCRVQFDRDEDKEGDNTGRMRIMRKDVVEGLATMAVGSPHQFGQWLSENDDEVTFDTAMQYIIFGRLIYA